jgi:hypothetical protein
MIQGVILVIVVRDIKVVLCVATGREKACQQVCASQRRVEF